MSEEYPSIFEEIERGNYELISENVTLNVLNMYHIPRPNEIDLINYVLVKEIFAGRKSYPILMERT